MKKVGIIGGTGLVSIEPWVAATRVEVDTPYGSPSSPLSVGEWGGRQVVFIPRHGGDQAVPPHKINYRANIRALKDSGVEQVIAVAAVGGIAKNTPPGAVVLPAQIIDYTWGRAHTFFDSTIEHYDYVDFSQPYTQALRRQLLAAAQVAEVGCVDGGVYGATQGPRLETAAEIARMAQDGCTLVGMTGMPEAALARELAMDYACCALVVNWAAGCSEDVVTLEAIRSYIAQGQQTLAALLGRFFSGVIDVEYSQ